MGKNTSSVTACGGDTFPFIGEGKGPPRAAAPTRDGGGKLLPVGADLCVRPASLSKGAPGEAGWGIPLTGTVPQVAPSSGPAGHLPPRGKVRRVREAAPYREKASAGAPKIPHS